MTLARYTWHPTPLSVSLDLYILEEPPYSDGCWSTDKTCAYPEAKVLIMVNKSLPGRAPEAIEFLRKWEFKAAGQVATELLMTGNNEDSDVGGTGTCGPDATRGRPSCRPRSRRGWTGRWRTRASVPVSARRGGRLRRPIGE